MKKQLVIPFCLILSILVLVSSCQKRYGYIQKVRVNDKSSAKKETPPRKKVPTLTLQQKKPPTTVKSAAFVIKSVEIPHVKTPVNPGKKNYTVKEPCQKHLIQNLRDTIPDSTKKAEPALSDIKLGNSNYKEILYLTVIISGIVLLALIFGFGIAVVSAAILDGGLMMILLDEVIVVISIIGAILLVPTYLITRYFIRLRKRTIVTYGGKEYTIAEIEKMSARVRSKRNLNNMAAWFILLVPVILVSIVTGIGFAYPFVFSYLLIKGILLFLKRNKEELPVD